MRDIVNVINLPKRTDRLRNFEIQATEQEFEYKVWNGIVDPAMVFRGINLSHKSIIRNAKQKRLARVTVAEDDIQFLGIGSWKYYLVNMPEDFDLYLGMVYEGKIGENNRLLPDPYTFSGMTLYTVNESFYDQFLAVKECDHIDKSLGQLAGEFKFYVCDRFVCKQSDGYSDQKKKDCKYDHLLKGRKLFGV